MTCWWEHDLEPALGLGEKPQARGYTDTVKEVSLRVTGR